MKLMRMSVAAVFALAGAASADVVLPGGEGNVLQTNLTLQLEGGQGGASDVQARVYDEWTSPPSTLNGLFNTGTQEIADDLNMVPNGVHWLANLGFAVANTAPTGSGRNGWTASGGQIRITFYRQDNGQVIPSVGGFTSLLANLPALNLAPQSSSRLNFGANSLLSLGWYFPTSNIYASLAHVSGTGTGGWTIADAGMQLRNGGTIGTSTDNLVGVGAGPQPTGNFNFGGTPFADSAWFIDTESVPAPGSIAMLGLGGLFAARRRRA